MKHSSTKQYIYVVIIVVLFSLLLAKSNSREVVVYKRVFPQKQRPIFNVPTQRIDPFTRIGYLYKENSDVMLPLHGRQTHVRSNTWNYFTYTNDDSRIRIDIRIKDRNCMKNTGCKELYDGDTINIPELNGLFKVKLYL